MLKTRVIPVLLLKDMGLVKTVQFNDPTYIGDPINSVRIFNEKEVDELIFLDISASIEKRPPNFELIADIASECFMPFAYGGGIKSLVDAEKILQLGAEKVVVNSIIFEHPKIVKDITNVFGSQAVIASIDIRKSTLGVYNVYSHSGTTKQKLSLSDTLKMAEEDIGVGEIFINHIDRDGTFKGYDIRLLTKVTEKTTCPVICCGGAKGLSDFRAAYNEGDVAAVAGGSCFVYHGKHKAVLLSYPSQKEMKEYLA